MSPELSVDAGRFADRFCHGPISGNPAELFQALTALMLASQQGFALFDETDRLRFANRMFRDVFMLADDAFPTWSELMRESYRRRTGTTVDSHDFDAWLRSAQSRRGKLPYRTIETQLGDGRWILTTETTLAGGWMLCVFTDISELGTDLRQLRQERDAAVKHPLSDELTGLSNRRYLMDKLRTTFTPTRAANVTLVMLDIDCFKKINDTHGHDFGDRVLRHFGSVLQEVAGRDDLIGRLGGEEFLLVISSGRPDLVEATLAKLYARLRADTPFGDMPDFRYSCSAGVAFAKPGEAASDALKRSDAALYRAKAEGRNRYALAA